MYSATTDEVIKTVDNCPSGALTYERNNVMSEIEETVEPTVKILVLKAGPLQIEGPCAIVDKEGKETIKQGKVFLCRCGGSSNKPYCDGTHKKNEFDK
jgi:hypothetical protein